jgi:hypothetical protein
MKKMLMIGAALVTLTGTAHADPTQVLKEAFQAALIANCKMAQVHQEWMDHYIDWKARLVAQGVPAQYLTGMDQAIVKFQKGFDEALAKCSGESQ